MDGWRRLGRGLDGGIGSSRRQHSNNNACRCFLEQTDIEWQEMQRRQASHRNSLATIETEKVDSGRVKGWADATATAS